MSVLKRISLLRYYAKKKEQRRTNNMAYERTVIGKHVVRTQQGKEFFAEITRTAGGKYGDFVSVECYREFPFNDKQTGQPGIGRDRRIPMGSLKVLLELLEKVDAQHNNGKAFEQFRGTDGMSGFIPAPASQQQSFTAAPGLQSMPEKSVPKTVQEQDYEDDEVAW
jgi:hypothetical protein